MPQRHAETVIQRRGSGLHPTPRPERAADSRTAEQEIVELLKEKPLGPAEISKLTETKLGTISDRLRRLKAQGLVERVDNGWVATSSP
jgi:predicted Rossmann fold nucleotide-binding protein DprA/Smf involved in DNA uptake